MRRFNSRGRLMLAVLLSLCFSSAIFAQDVTVTGTVTDANDGSTLPGVSILVKGTSTGTVTNVDGVYNIQVDPNAILVFNFVGYGIQEISVNGQSTINTAMVTDIVGLDEVVAIGYGSVRKRDITGSVGSVSSDKLLAAPISSLDAGLQGKIAGVQVQQTSGAPGQKMKIRVRGSSSINFSNEPLYVIDGFIGADITTVNPNDIASIDILKDASATAIYGSRGANGVVLITTNAPAQGKTTVSYDGNVGVSNMVNQYDILSAGDMAELMNIQDAANGNIQSFTDGSVDPNDNEVAYFKENGGTDWVDMVTRQGIKHQHSLNVNGGNEKLRYYFSANYVDDQGVIDESFYKRGSIRSNIAGEVSRWIDFKFNTFGTSTSSQNNARQNNGLANTIGSAVVYPQVWDAYNEDGTFVDPTTYNPYGTRYRPGATANPILGNMQNQETFNQRITSNIDLDFKITKNLTLTVSNAGSFSTGFTGELDIIDEVNVDRLTAGAKQRYARATTYINTENLTYDNQFGDHSLKVSAIYEFQKNVSRNLNSKVAQLATLGNGWDIMQHGVPTLTESSFGERKLRSYMGRVNYDFADKYLLTFSLRADGTSVFQEDTRWGIFPSGAFAWRASEEPFVQEIDWIHNLKLRAGAGVTGNSSIPNYYTQNRLLNDDFQYIYWVRDGMNPNTGVIPGPLVNPAMQWEKNTQYNLGVDFAVLRGKVSTVIDFYSKQSTDVIIGRTIPMYIGAYGSSLTDNVADISNKGFEFSVNWDVINDRTFKWDMNFNVARNKNMVKDVRADQDFLFVDNEEALGIWMGSGTSNNKFIVQEGHSLGSMWGLKYEGLWQEDEAAEAANYGSFPGEPKFQDVNTVDTDGDGIPDAPDGEINDADRQIIGQAAPEFTYGIGTTVQAYGFDLSIQCVGSVGNDIYNYSKNIMDREILNPEYLNRWSTTNSGSEQQIMPVGTEYNRSHITSQYVEDGTFFRVANLTLGYTVPQSVTDALQISSLRFYVGANNLFTITNYSGLDPEGSSSALDSDSQAGIDAFSYPLVRTVTGGLKVVF